MQDDFANESKKERKKYMKKLKLLVIAAHPADMFDHCGGTLLHHTRRGDEVVAVSMTHGLRIHDIIVSEQFRFQNEKLDDDKLNELIKERTLEKNKEVIEACKLFGVTDVRFLNYNDDILLVTEDKIRAVARVIRDVKPDIIITHYPLTELYGCESSHGNVGKIVLNAFGYAGTVDFSDENTSHRTAQMFFMTPIDATGIKYNVLSGLTPCYCDFYVRITDVIEEKVKALDKMRSQQYGGIYAKKTTETWNGVQGTVISEAYAEGFIRFYPEYDDYLTVGKYRLDRQNEEEIKTRKRFSQMITPNIELPD